MSKTIPIEHIAKKLANLELSDAQLRVFEQQLTPILEHMEELSGLDLAHVPVTARVMEEENILREDSVEPSFSQEDALKNARATHEGFFVAEYTLEQKDA